MKLKKLQIKKYKNLIDFTVDFESGKGLSILIGNNGSGKSNVLEAISGIFVNAYSAKAIHKFVYSLTYEIKGKEVKLEQTIYRCQYYVDGKVIAVKELALRGLLPTNAIALYSGEDKRWWHNYYEPFYLKFTRDINAGTTNTLSPKMYYINKYYWDIALLSLVYSTAEDDKQFLKDTIGRDTVDHILLFYITTSFIPYKDGVTEGDFLIEDYFSWDDTIKAIVEDVIPDRKHPIKMLPNLPDKIKKELEKRINQFEADEFNGFIPLLDKIVELTKEQAV